MKRQEHSDVHMELVRVGFFGSLMYIRLRQNARSHSSRLVGVGFLVYSKFENIW